MRKISSYKSISGKYNIANRADFLKKLDELQHKELVTKFAVKISQEENNQIALDKFSKDLEEISGDIDSLCMLLGRDAEIRKQLLDDWDKQEYEELKASFGVKFAHEEGNAEAIEKFINDFNMARKSKEAIEELINSDEVYHDEETNDDEEKKIEEQNNNEPEIEDEDQNIIEEEISENNQTNVRDEINNNIDENVEDIDNQTEQIGFFKKAGIYVKAAAIAVGRTIKQKVESIRDKIKNSLEQKQKQKLLNSPTDVELMEGMRVIQWTDAEAEAVEKLGYLNKNDKEDLYFSDAPKDEKREEFKMTLELDKDKKQEEDKGLIFFDPSKKKNKEADDERDIV